VGDPAGRFDTPAMPRPRPQVRLKTFELLGADLPLLLLRNSSKMASDSRMTSKASAVTVPGTSASLPPGIPEMLLAGRERELLGQFAFPALSATPGAITDTDIDEFVRTSRPDGWSGAICLY
jgi:hypothetical protein